MIGSAWYNEYVQGIFSDYTSENPNFLGNDHGSQHMYHWDDTVWDPHKGPHTIVGYTWTHNQYAAGIYGVQLHNGGVLDAWSPRISKN